MGWHARRQYTWAHGSKNLLGLLRFVLTRVGLTLTAPDPSPTLTDHKPEFTIHPGESGSTAVRRLLAMAPDRLFFRGQEGRLLEPRESDVTNYALGTAHVVLEGRYTQAALRHTRVQVYGAAGMAESFLWEEIPLRGELLLQQYDQNLDTVQKAQDRGQQLVRQLEMQSLSAVLAAPPICGLEMYDVVMVTDPRAGLTAARRRVMGLSLEYRRLGTPHYIQRLLLGGV